LLIVAHRQDVVRGVQAAHCDLELTRLGGELLVDGIRRDALQRTTRATLAAKVVRQQTIKESEKILT
jgi:hypothetical protein